MILGTHNSLSYAKPTKWWMKFINFTSKCQELTIEEQWECGVKYFDFRLSPNNLNKARHGLVEYDVNIDKELTFLNNMAKEYDEKIYVAINLEGSEDTAIAKYLFEDIIADYTKKYKYLTICGGFCKNPWHQIVKIDNPQKVELYWEFLNWTSDACSFKEKVKMLITNILHFSPKYWAKKNNNKWKSTELADNTILVLDFVNL